MNATFPVAVGLISYGAYLWHWPLLVFARHLSITEPSELTFAILALLTFPLAYLSWRYIEKPFRTKSIFSRKAIFTLSFIGSVLFITVGLAGHFSNGFEDFWLSRQSESVKATYLIISRAKENYGADK